jgi:TrkA domain protein
LEITQTTVPGFGVMHHLVTRSGKELRVLVENNGKRELYLYGPAPSEAEAMIVLERDEADAVADLLHSESIPDRLAEIERRIAELAGGGHA